MENNSYSNKKSAVSAGKRLSPFEGLDLRGLRDGFPIYGIFCSRLRAGNRSKADRIIRISVFLMSTGMVASPAVAALMLMVHAGSQK